MNHGIDTLPDRCDVLVVGAGPAGSACAATLARAGFDVVLVGLITACAVVAAWHMRPAPRVAVSAS